MHEKVKKENMQTLVRNPALFAFSKKVLTESYVECVPGLEKEMRALMQEAFERLEASKDNQGVFNAAVKFLVEDLFRKGESGFWFNQAYQNYKHNFKPTRRYANLEPWLIGNKVLDIGCGDGLTSAELHKHGYQVSLTDVLDYRAEQARHLRWKIRKPYLTGMRDSTQASSWLCFTIWKIGTCSRSYPSCAPPAAG
jgi:hypothetical protein